MQHGIDLDAIRHALAQAIVVFDLEPDADPPRVLALGPDLAGNLLEVIWLEFDGAEAVVIHAMAMRPKFRALLSAGEDRG